MAEYNVRINVKNSTGYDQLYPESKSDIINFDKTGSNLSSTNVEAAIKEVNTKANTNKTNIGTLSSLTTDSKTNLVGAINEVDSHANTAQSTANTNKTNIGTLSSLKTSIKTSIVNAINSLYDATIGKTLKTLDEVLLATSGGYFADALAIKEMYNKLNENYIIEEGENTDDPNAKWHYRKYSDGSCEAWCKLSNSYAITTVSGNIYRSGELTLSIPSNIFKSTPTIVTATANSAGVWWVCSVILKSTTLLSFYITCGSSSASTNRQLSFYLRS